MSVVDGSLGQDLCQSDVVTLADGSFAIAWAGVPADGVADVLLCVFNADGTLRAKTECSVATQSARFVPQLTALSDVGFAMVWSGATADDDEGIAVRLFDRDGKAMGDAATMVNAQTDGNQLAPQIATLAGGGYVFAWTKAGAPGETGVLSLRVVHGDGSVSDRSIDGFCAESQPGYKIVALAGGGFAVVYEAAAPAEGGSPGLRMQIFDADGTLRVESAVSGFSGKACLERNPAVTALADGGFVVAWEGDRHDDATGIALQIFDADGTARAQTDFAVNNHTDGEQLDPIVTALKDGGFVVLWRGATLHDPDGGLAMQVYNADGKTRIAGDIAVNGYTQGLQGHPCVAALAGGGFAVAWTTKDEDGNSIALRVFNAGGIARMEIEEPLDGTTVELHGSPRIVALADGGLALTWQARGADGVHIYEKVFRAVNDAPTGASTTIGIKEDSTYVFSVEDFGFKDANGDSLKAVKIASVPANGTLTLDGRMVVPGQEIKAADIAAGKLVWAVGQNLNGIGLGALSFNVIDDGGSDFGGVDTDPFTRKITFDVAGVNDDPVARVVTGSTYENSLFTIEVADAVIDADDDNLTMLNAKIVSGFGSVMIDAKKMLIYNPMGGANPDIGDGETRTVVISYTVSDGRGGTATATITLTVLGISADIFSGTNGADRLTGTSYGDLMYGKGGDDTLRGGAGNDLLDGGSGADTLTGEAGNDSYVVDNAGDKIVEAANGGTDTVQASRSYTLTENVEKLILIGTGNYGGTGNAQGNTITGNSGANILKGLGGNDRLSGGGGNDCLDGGNGNDVLNGGAGADKLLGGAGDDTYVVDDAGDCVVEVAGGGSDTVEAGCSYTLAAHVERLTLTGVGNYSGTGNTLANRIVGNAAANVLKGLDGNDVLLGGRGNDRIHGGNGSDRIAGDAGADMLSGGSGCDTFVFRSVSDSTLASAGRDTIVDFSKAAGDRIDLSAIDARPASSADNAFVFIGKAAFTKCAGELRYQKSGSDTLVLADTDGDGRADFSILVSGSVAFAKGDFLL
ncbi:cadherin-like domain-containing protein [Mycoplana ramosa]|uniref:Cadherin-like domain-containing protein n=1 Tax=Mycoplana ramosa TaxID=40837 RepID=A0ABW3YZT1_MYCRA